MDCPNSGMFFFFGMHFFFWFVFFFLLPKKYFFGFQKPPLLPLSKMNQTSKSWKNSIHQLPMFMNLTPLVPPSTFYLPSQNNNNNNNNNSSNTENNEEKAITFNNQVHTVCFASQILEDEIQELKANQISVNQDYSIQIHNNFISKQQKIQRKNV